MFVNNYKDKLSVCIIYSYEQLASALRIILQYFGTNQNSNCLHEVETSATGVWHTSDDKTQ